MKLRAISLTNVRRFAGQTAAITGLGDGLSVIAAPNEAGKSTVFDALQALFFAPHGSRARDVAGLQPHAGGRVGVAAEIDLPEGRFRVEKAFLARPMARVTDRDTGRVLAQDDAAEAWIARIAGAGSTGPAGLLWVRQGMTGLEAAGSAERDRLLAARRDLLSSVAGEIDQMTGGRRMDRVRAACAAALERLATPKGKLRKAGPWHEAREEIAALDAEIAGLEEQVRDLAEALDRRRLNAARLAQLHRPEAQEARQAALALAEAAVARAEEHATRLARALQEARLAGLAAEAAARARADLAAALEPLPRLARALAAAEETAAALAARMARAREAEAEARAAHADAEQRLQAARTAARGARRRAAAAEAATRRAGLAAALAAAEEQERIIADAAARLSAIAATPDRLAVMDRALDAALAARAAAAAGAVTLLPAYDGAARIGLEGAPLPAAALAVTRPLTLDLPGIGRLAVDPGAGAGDPAGLSRAEAALSAALDACGATTPAEARDALRARTGAETARILAADRLRALAPEGVAALRAALAAAEAPDAGEADDPAPDMAAGADPETMLTRAETDEAAARAARDTARAAADSLSPPLAEARAAAALARERLAAAEAAAGDPATRAARLAACAAEADTAEAAARAARAAHEALAAAAPDLATARAECARARSAIDAARAEADRLGLDQARLDGIIQTQADLAVDARLTERREARAAAAARETRLAAEAEALAHLAGVLDAARLAAREAYFGPVQRELAPLLAILAEDAALSFDADSLLPGTLARGGAAEPVSILSGGTQEQIAILTRLAFARLFARAGTPVPVILDDALVHSDDTRILRMFTALHRIAADQQVIVLTCRTMAFEALGGTRPAFTVTPA